MNTQRPTVVTIAAILLIVLSLFVAGLGIARQYGLLGQGFGNRQFGAGQTPNRNFIPPNGFPSNRFPNNGFPNDQNNGGTTPNFNPNQQIGTGFVSLFRLIRPLTIGLDIGLLILAVDCCIWIIQEQALGCYPINCIISAVNPAQLFQEFYGSSQRLH